MGDTYGGVNRLAGADTTVEVEAGTRGIAVDGCISIGWHCGVGIQCRQGWDLNDINSGCQKGHFGG